VATSTANDLTQQPHEPNDFIEAERKNNARKRHREWEGEDFLLGGG